MEKTAVVPLHAFGHPLPDGGGVIRCVQHSGDSEDS